jgi:hypothetical protein
MTPTPWFRGSRLAFLIPLFTAFVLRVSAQVTETPQTMAPGDVLLRVDAITVGVDQDTSAPNQYRTVGAGWALLSTGLDKTLDVEVGTQLYVRDDYQLLGSNHSSSGLGDITVRSKWTFWQDSSQDEAVALIPYVDLPNHNEVGGNGHTEGGLIMPWAMQVAPGVKAGAMGEVDELRNVANTRYDTRLYASAYLQATVLGKLGAYGEATASTSTGGGSSTWATVNLGATLSASSNFQWDYEIGRVVGPSATQWTQTLRFRWKL